MEIAEILHQFERSWGEFPHAAVEAAVERREEIIPELLRILEDTADRAKEVSADGEYLAHIYAMYLLAQFREARAYPLVVRMALLPPDLGDFLLGDFTTEGLDRVLASVCDGDLTGIKSIVEHRKADEWARASALDSLVYMVLSDRLNREEAIDYLAQLFRGKLEQKCTEMWVQLVTCSCDLRALELMPDIKRAYERNLVDPSDISLKDVEFEMDGHPGYIRTPYLVENIADEMASWQCFEKPEAKPKKRPILTWAKPSEPAQTAAAPQSKLSNSKPGRNDPCPCGSGKKYKKCCGA